MEIFANLTTCPVCKNVYNADNHAECPFCSGTRAAQDVGSFAPTEAPGMAAPASNPGTFGATVAPGMAQPSGGPQPFSATQPVNNPHMASSQSQPFFPTVSIMQAKAGENAGQTEPVVGWLVCVDGPMRGNDYRIRAGYNYIGREIGDIHIRGDQTISRQRHAKIAYDATTHQYFFGPDEGRNLLRVNGRTIMVPVELHNYDILTIGQTQLMFVGLCGEHFSWEQG